MGLPTKPACPELVEGPSFLGAKVEGQGFDKLSPNGREYLSFRRREPYHTAP